MTDEGRLEKLEKECAWLNGEIARIVLENEEENQKIKEALEFYADVDNWWWKVGGDKDYMNTISEEDMEKVTNTGRIQGYEIVGGKKAREILSKIKL